MSIPKCYRSNWVKQITQESIKNMQAGIPECMPLFKLVTFKTIYKK